MNRINWPLAVTAIIILCAACGKPQADNNNKTDSGNTTDSGEVAGSDFFDVETIATHAFNGNNFILEGRLIGSNSSGITLGFYYENKSSASIEEVLAGEVDENNSFFATVTNLQEGEEYFYRAFARNDEEEKWGNTLSFSTSSSSGSQGGRGPVATSFASGDGSINNPYIIADASHLRFLSDECARGKTFRGDYILVIKDIVVNSNLIISGQLNSSIKKEIWIPINGFQGVFDGGDHIISGLYSDSAELKEYTQQHSYIGLFGQIKGIIKNVRIEDSYFSSLTGARIGGIVGEHEYDSSISTTENYFIKNCHFSGIIDGGFRYGTGGIVGTLSLGTVLNCTFSGVITGAYGGGSGIVGGFGSGGTIANCINYGTISGYYCSGILGQGVGGKVNIYNCINAGEIKYYNPVSAKTVYLVGIFVGGSNATLNNNINYGLISGPDDGVGAIFGSTFDSHTVSGKNYFLETSAKSQSIKYISPNKLGVSMTEKEMKASTFLSTLNQAAKSFDNACSWKFGDDGFPTLDLSD